MGDGSRERRPPYLPGGYSVDEDADLLTLRRPDGSMVAVFGARADAAREIEREAWEDFGGRGRLR